MSDIMKAEAYFTVGFLNNMEKYITATISLNLIMYLSGLCFKWLIHIL
jgi:hypothetical protein